MTQCVRRRAFAGTSRHRAEVFSCALPDVGGIPAERNQPWVSESGSSEGTRVRVYVDGRAVIRSPLSTEHCSFPPMAERQAKKPCVVRACRKGGGGVPSPSSQSPQRKKRAQGKSRCLSFRTTETCEPEAPTGSAGVSRRCRSSNARRDTWEPRRFATHASTGRRPTQRATGWTSDGVRRVAASRPDMEPA